METPSTENTDYYNFNDPPDETHRDGRFDFHEPSPCLPEEKLVPYLHGKLDEEEAAYWDSHVDDCSHCNERLDELDAVEDAVFLDDIFDFVSLSPGEETSDAGSPGINGETLPRIDAIRIVKCIGEGGFGKVYEGYDENLKRKVAVKTLRSSRIDDELLLRNFRNEAEILARLRHPGIPQIYRMERIGESDAFCIVMEYFDGGNLYDYYRQCEYESIPKLDPAEEAELEKFWGSDDPVQRVYDFQMELYLKDPWPAMYVAEIQPVLIGACKALACAHRHGVLHRDISPGNIFRTRRKKILLLDFGIAEIFSSSVATGTPERIAGAALKSNEWAGREAATFQALTSDGLVCGSPGYIAPELLNGKAGPDVRSDIYSLGATLHFLLTGKSPHEKDGRIRLPYQYPVPDVRRSRRDVPDWLADLHDRMLAEDPADRPESVDSILMLLLAANARIEQRHGTFHSDDHWKRYAYNRRLHDGDYLDEKSAPARPESSFDGIKAIPPFGCAPESCSGCVGINYTERDRESLLRFSFSMDHNGLFGYALRPAYGDPSHWPEDGLEQDVSVFDIDFLNEDIWQTGESFLDTDRKELRLRPFMGGSEGGDVFLVSALRELKAPFAWIVDFVPRPGGKIVFRLESDEQRYRRIEFMYHYSGASFYHGDIAEPGPEKLKYFLPEQFSFPAKKRRDETVAPLFRPPDSAIDEIGWLLHDPLVQNQTWYLSILCLCGKASLILNRVELRYPADDMP